MRRRTPGTILCLLVGACGSAASSGEWIASGAAKGVVVAGARHDCPGTAAEPGNAWTPTAGDIARLETRLGPALSEALRSKPSLRPEQYLRQYSGVECAEKRWVFVDGTHLEVQADLLREWASQGLIARLRNRSPAEPEYWIQGGVEISDGGALSFDAQYSVEGDRMEAIRFGDSLNGDRITWSPSPAGEPVAAPDNAH